MKNSAQNDANLAQQLKHYCATAEEFLAAERQRIEHIERDLVRQLAEIAAEHTSTAEFYAAGDRQPLKSVASERDMLLSRNRDLEQAIELLETAVSEHNGSETSELQQQTDDLARRNELANDEIRQLKAELTEAREQLAASGSAAANQPSTCQPEAGAGFDWESQKQRLIAALNADGSAQHSEQDRVTIKSTIEQTDEAVAAKNREIESLRRQLEQSSAPDLAEQTTVVLDADEVIQQEREKLSVLYEEMREKQRRAEIEISLDRAKLARERAAVEEQLAAAGVDVGPPSNDESIGAKKNRGNWRTRLGLSD
ncbi:MAG: hypothetical protein VX988_08580 [Planctomycetota bacterium]|nr:hypothetical protein [Planctomycetota bacterium]